jgi:hypothetical protein
MPVVRHAPRCPECDGDTHVIGTQPVEIELHGRVIPTYKRTRLCSVCGFRIETVELFIRDVYPGRFAEMMNGVPA